MSRAQSSATTVSSLFEVTENVIPATPAWNNGRWTGENLVVKNDTVRSEEIDPSRNVRDLVRVSGSGEGGFNFEYSQRNFEDYLKAAMWSDWVANSITNGVMRNPMSLEVQYKQGAVDTYKRFSGMYVNELSMKYEAAKILTGSIGFLGRTGVYDNAPVAGATYNPPVNTLTPLAGHDAFFTGSTGFVVDCVTMMSLEIKNNLRVQQCLGQDYGSGVGYGDFEVGGDLEMFLDENTYANLPMFVNGLSGGIVLTLGDTVLTRTRLTLPKVKLSDVTVAADGKNQDVMIKAKWVGLKDTGINGTLKIDRLV